MSRGMTLAETLVVVALAAVLVLTAFPVAAALREGGRAGAAARSVAMQFAAERWRAVTRQRSGGLWFAAGGAGWTFRTVEDGNGNGLRTVELRDGTDPSRTAWRRLGEDVPGTAIAIPSGGPFPEAPPGRGWLAAGDDPVRFGRSEIVSFSPDGSSSSGTLYVTDGTALYAVVLFGPTARVRVWRFDRSERRWTL